MYVYNCFFIFYLFLILLKVGRKAAFVGKQTKAGRKSSFSAWYHSVGYDENIFTDAGQIFNVGP
jgi:hypothetical protein